MNRLTLAVAGGRKTQSIVDACATTEKRRILLLTYTQANQEELRQRLAHVGPIACNVEVRGWFSFLMAHWIRPYLPMRFPDRRLRGLNFEGDPGRVKNEARFLDREDRAYKRHLARLSVEVNVASKGAVIDRLTRIYDAIYIDEVQDLNGYDLEVLKALLRSDIDLHLVGDVRQAILLTNVQEQKNKQYKGIRIQSWFDKQKAAGRLVVSHRTETWRSNQTIARFADAIFEDSWGFDATRSHNSSVTEHDGVFVIDPAHAADYLAKFAPMCLRHSVKIGQSVDLPYINIGKAKGLEAERVLIWPTKTVVDFLRRGAALSPTGACSLYVAVTRAFASVAFVVDRPERLLLPIWTPSQ